MSFQSYPFILLFLPIVVIFHRLLITTKNERYIPVWLLICSLVFIGLFNPIFVPIAAATATINYGFYKRILRYNGQDDSANRKNVALILGLVFNIGLLFFFKYYNFFLTASNQSFGTSFTIRKILVPLGISYTTFKSIALLVSASRKEIGEYGFIECFLYQSFFPQIISGPIALPDQFLSQLDSTKPTDKESLAKNFSAGLTIFVLGLAKKIFFADTFGAAADWGYAQDLTTLNSMTSFIISISYTLQIYFDFSGYSDMAKGIGLMVNLETPVNFNSPYKSFTIGEFWRRWHMTLTTFLTKYLYIPLGGNRKGTVRTYLNILIVFLISGFWHGANWTFLFWGFMHGVAQVVAKFFSKQIERFHPAFNWITTFLFVNAAWIFFRAEKISDAVQIVKQILKFNLGPIPAALQDCFNKTEFSIILNLFNLESYSFLILPAFFIVAMILILNSPNADEIADRLTLRPRNAILLGIVFAWSILSLSSVTQFLYYNF